MYINDLGIAIEDFHRMIKIIQFTGSHCLVHRLILRDTLWEYRSEEFNREIATGALLLYDRSDTQRKKESCWQDKAGIISGLDAFMESLNWQTEAHRTPD